MKIFYITAEFDLYSKPDWLDSFRLKYDHPHPYHLTLKNATYMDEARIPELQSELKLLISDYSAMDVLFDTLEFNMTSKGTVIMVVAKPNKDLIEMQNKIHEKLSVYGDNIKESFKKYESEFLPHITIARQLSEDQLVAAKKELVEPIACKAHISDIVLTVVSEMLIEEMNNPTNRINITLKS